MRTPKQIAASRANGAKSLGPVSLQGKIAASRNSTRHGLFAENIVLEAEDTGRFLELVESLFQEHNPRTPTQRLLVENIAAARWRQWRIWGMQKVAFDDEVASPSTTNDPPLRAVLAWKNSADGLRTHELLLRYEIALDRQISRSLVRLQQLQAVQSSGKASAEPMAPPLPARKPPASETQEESASGAKHTANATVEPIVRRSEKSIFAKRTQQPVETTVRHIPPSPANPRPESRPIPTKEKEGKIA